MLLNFYRTLSVALAFTYGAQAISLESAAPNDYMYMSDEIHDLAQTYGAPAALSPPSDNPTEAGAALAILTDAVASANKINVQAAADMAKAKAITCAKKSGAMCNQPPQSAEEKKKADEKKKCTTKKCQQKAKE